MRSEDVTKEKALQDLKVVANDAEELIKATAGELGDKAKETRDRLIAALDSAKTTCLELEEQVRARAMEGAKVTDKAIREHPYESLGIVFGLGLLIGVLINRK